MKPALLFFSVLTSFSLWFGAQDTRPITCNGKPLPIVLLPGPKMSGPELPLRFGGTRPFPRPPINGYRSDDAFRLVIKTSNEFNDFWKQLTTSFQPSQVIPPPEVDFSKEMVIVAAMGMKPTSGYFVIIDGACEVDGHVEVFVSNIDSTKCGGGQLQALTYPADAVRLPQTDLPVVFRETQIPCTEWRNLIQRSNRSGGE
jgi:hypothetical protein